MTTKRHPTPGTDKPSRPGGDPAKPDMPGEPPYKEPEEEKRQQYREPPEDRPRKNA